MTVLQSAVTKMGNGHLNTVLLDSEGGHCTSTKSADSGQRSQYVSANTLSIALCVVTLSLGLGILCLEVYRVREVWSLQTEVEWLKKEVQILIEDFAEEVEEEYDEEYEDDVIDDRPPEALTRRRRQVTGPSIPRSDGVPILNSSYGISHLNESSEGLRIYESLMINEGRGEPRTQGISWEATAAPLLDHHKKSPLWVPRNERRRFPNAHTNPQIGGSKSFFGRHKKSRLPNIRATELPRIMERKSRVKQTGRTRVSPPYIRVSTDEKSQRPLKRTSGHTDEIMMKVVQPTDGDNMATPTGHQTNGKRPLMRRTRRRRGRKVNGRKKNRRRKHKEEEEDRKLLKNIIDENNLQKEGHQRITAAHFKGDTSNYSLHHQHYAGNGRVRTTDGMFTNWKKSAWMDSMKFTNFYPIDGGTVTIQEAGLYFIYAQINYVDAHDLNGFEVFVNTEPYLQCSTMTHTTSSTTKTNTCYTGGATYLAAGDKVSVRDVEAMRYAVFTSPKSFFGLIKLSDIKI